MAGIEIRGLTKDFRAGTRALVGIDLDVAGGELVVLVGPSGSGKTTLLRLIAGLDQPTSGTIRLGGQEMAGVPPHKRNVALVFQNLALYGHLKVADNLRFGWSYATGEQGNDGVAVTADLLGITHLLDRYPSELSGGEQQRVALGRAIVRQPAALLLDEPLSSLDGPMQRGLRRELRRVQRQLGVPTIYVTHDQAEAMALGDRIAVLDRGRLQQVGTPEEVYHRPANCFVAEFLGPHGMNLIEGELEHKEEDAIFVNREFRLALPLELGRRLASSGQRLVCGFRPEDVTVAPNGTTGVNFFQGTVKTRESIGGTTFLSVGVNWYEDITVQSGSSMPLPAVFDVITLRLDPQRMHWFDPTTGNRLET